LCKNTLGVPVTRLRFRLVDLTTINNRPSGQSDLRVLSANGQVTNSALGFDALCTITFLDTRCMLVQE
jgi:hypothetical protein